MKDRTFDRRMAFVSVLGILACIGLGLAWSQPPELQVSWAPVDGFAHTSEPCAADSFELSPMPNVGAETPSPQYDNIMLTRVLFSCIRGEFEGVDTDENGFVSPDEWDDLNANGVYDFQLMTLTEVAPWAEAVYDVRGPMRYPEGHANEGEAILWSALTNEQRGKFVRRQFRDLVMKIYTRANVPPAINSAKATAEAAVADDAELFPAIEE